MKRRKLLGLTTVTLSSVIAGCIPGSESASRLTIDDLSVNADGSTVVLEFVVENHNVRQDSDADFHDVTVLGYANDGSLVCSKEIGDVSHEHDNNDGKPVSMRCSASPHQITFKAQESPCDEDVIINIAVYREDEDSWIFDRYQRKCDEGFPPSPRG